MTIEEIKRNAPKDADHYHKESFIKHECGNWYIWHKGRWDKMHPIVYSAYKNEIKPL